jgi:hypothetical protein
VAVTAAALAFAAGAYGASDNHAKNDAGSDSVQFTGLNLVFVLIAAAVVLIAGFGLRRSLTRRD